MDIFWNLCRDNDGLDDNFFFAHPALVLGNTIKLSSD